MMKKILGIFVGVISVPIMVFGAPTSWDYTSSILQPLMSQWSAQIKGSYFTATSTSVASQFPYASSTALSAGTLCLNGDCRSAWPTGGTLSYTPWGGTVETAYATNTVASTTVAWFKQGMLASSTSYFDVVDVQQIFRAGNLDIQGNRIEFTSNVDNINFYPAAANGFRIFDPSSGGGVLFDTSSTTQVRSLLFADEAGTPALSAYRGGFASGAVTFGNNAATLATSSAFTWNNSGSLLTVTNASTTHLSAGSFCLNGDCRSAWPTGGSGAWPFTPTTYAGTSVQSTTTPLWLKDTQLIASSTLVGYATSTEIYTQKFNTEIWVPVDFATKGCAGDSTKTDFGACLNALSDAYTGLGGEGITIHVPNMTVEQAQFRTNVRFDNSTQLVSLKCVNGAVIKFGGYGYAFTWDSYNPTGHVGYEVSGCVFQGQSSLIAAGQANTATSTGFMFGGSIGAPGLNFHDNTVNGFGTQVEIGANAYMLNFNDNKFSGGNGGLSATGSLIHINTASNSGEANMFTNNHFTDPGNSTTTNCIYIEQGSTADNMFMGGSIDNCQMRVLGSNGKTTVRDVHVENAAFATYGEYIPFYFDSASSNMLVFEGNLIADIANNSSQNFDTIIKHGVNLVANGNHIENYGGQTITYFADHSLNNGSSAELICGTTIEGGGLSFISRNWSYTQAKGIGCHQNVANSYGTGLIANSDNTVDWRVGNGVNGIRLNENGDATIAQDLTVTRNATSAQFTATGRSWFTGLATFGNASSSIFSASTICLDTCRTAWPVSGGTFWPWTALTNWGTSTNATTTAYTAPAYFASSSIASQFPYASSTAFSAATLCLNGDCRSAWPTGGGSWPFTATTYAGTAVQSTTTPLWLNGTQLISSTTLTVYATSTEIYTQKFNTEIWVPVDFATKGCAGDSTITDFGACLNALSDAYTGLGGEGITIHVPNMTVARAQFTTPVNFNNSGQLVSLKCVNGAVIKYGGWGYAFTWNSYNPTGHLGWEISGCIFQGQDSLIAAGQANTATTTGILFGGNTGAVGVNMHDNTVNGFGTQVEIGANAYMLNFNDNKFSGGNGGLSATGSLIHINTASNSGEANMFRNNHFTDPGNSSSTNCIYIEQGGTADNVFDGGSIDNCQMRVLGSNGKITVSDVHVENAAYATYGEYIPFYFDSASSNMLVFTGNLIADISNNASQNFDTIVKHGVNLVATGNHLENYGGQTVTYFFDHSLNNGSSAELICGTTIEGGGLSFISRNWSYTQAKGIGCHQNVANSYGTGLIANSDNTVDWRVGNGVNGIRLNENGDATIAQDLTVTRNATSAQITATGRSWFTGLATFGNASSSIFSASTLCLDTCRTTWPTGSGISWPWTSLTNWATSTNATTTAYTAPAYFASSTLASQFPYASSTALSASTLFVGTGSGDSSTQYGSDANAWAEGSLSSDNSFRIASSTGLSSNVALTILKSSLNIGVGTTSPWGRFSIASLGSVPAFVISAADTLVKFIVTSAGKVGIGTATPLHDLDVRGRIAAAPSYDCNVLFLSQSNVTADQLGSATVPSFGCDGHMFIDVQTTGAGILAYTAANSETGTASGTPPYMQILDASISAPAANNLVFLKGAMAGSATSSLGKGVAMQATLRLPNSNTATSTAYVFGFSDVALTSIATLSTYSDPANSCIVTATSTNNWLLVCAKASVQTIANTGVATSTSAVKVLLVVDSTGASVYFNSSSTPATTIAAGSLPVVPLRPYLGVGKSAGGNPSIARMGVANLEVWAADNF